MLILAAIAKVISESNFLNGCWGNWKGCSEVQKSLEAELNPHLDLDAQAGEVWVGLQVQVGGGSSPDTLYPNRLRKSPLQNNAG